MVAVRMIGSIYIIDPLRLSFLFYRCLLLGCEPTPRVHLLLSPTKQWNNVDHFATDLSQVCQRSESLSLTHT